MSERRCTFSEKLDRIPDNIVFVGCCNPYRVNVKTRRGQEDEEVGLVVERSNSKLSHKVFPICDSLINYVYDFGQLATKDEEKYIRSMIISSVKAN
jgi:hypothetical protein